MSEERKYVCYGGRNMAVVVLNGVTGTKLHEFKCDGIIWVRCAASLWVTPFVGDTLRRL